MSIHIEGAQTIELANHEEDFLRSLADNHDANANFGRSFLFVPLNKNRFFDKLPTLPADGYIFDLEDSVPQAQKALARDNTKLLGGTLSELKRLGKKSFLRINSYLSEEWTNDLATPHLSAFDGIMLSKVEVGEVEKVLPLILSFNPNFEIMSIIESPSAVMNLKDIIAGYPKMSVAVGYGDLSLALGVKRSNIVDSRLLQYALETTIFTAASFSVPVVSSPYRDFSEGSKQDFIREAKFEASCGVAAKTAIHPSHLSTINEVFSDPIDSLTESITILRKFANNKDTNAQSMDSQYYGLPSFKRSVAILTRSVQRGDIKFGESL